MIQYLWKFFCWLISKRHSSFYDICDVIILIAISIITSIIADQYPKEQPFGPIVVLCILISLKGILILINRIENPIDKIISLINSEGSVGVVEDRIKEFLNIAESRLEKGDCVFVVTNTLHSFDMQNDVINVVTDNLLKGVSYTYFVYQKSDQSQAIQNFKNKISNCLDTKKMALPKDKRDQAIIDYLKQLNFRRYWDGNILCNIAFLKNSKKPIGFWYSVNHSEPENSVFLELDSGNIHVLEDFFSSMKKCSWSYDVPQVH